MKPSEFIKEREILTESCFYMIGRLKSHLKTARNGEARLTREKITILKDWINRADKEAQEVKSPAFLATCKYFNIHEYQLKSNDREKPLPFARQIFSYISVKHEKRGLSETGRMINKSHSTVLYHCEQIEWQKEIYPEVRKAVKSILNSLQAEKTPTP